MKPVWWLTKDGDLDCLELYEQHYSAYHYADGRKRRLFVGPGEKVVLRTRAADAMFVWRNFIDDSEQEGINCAVFRNESPQKSSDLIRQADSIADCLWPDCRHYTFVDQEKVRSTNPGFCFIAAGWRRCGFTKGGLVILERDRIAAMQNRYDFLVDAWVRGMADGAEVEAAHAALEAAMLAAAPSPEPRS